MGVYSLPHLLTHSLCLILVLLGTVLSDNVMPEEKTIDAKKGDARDDRLQYIRKTQQEVSE